MFNLIVAVISIALIAAMAAASIFYGGTAFGEGTAKAQASTLINNGQQISGAQQLYMIDNSGNRANDIDVLTSGGYLQAVPSAPSTVIAPDDGLVVAAGAAAWQIDEVGRFAYIELDDDASNQQNSPAFAVCAEIEAQGGATSATGDAFISAAGSAEQYDNLDTDLATLNDDQFICATTSVNLNTAAGTTIFAYKL